MFLTQGNTGTSVKNCQYTLHMLTYNVNGIDGSYGPGMTAAVRLYQQNNGLTVNGNIDTSTWNSLVASITQIKQYLRAKGFYLVSSFYGVGDSTLYDAVLAFQRANGLSADGMVGPATRIKLFSSGAGNTVVGDNEFPLVQGDSGDNVLYLQYGLHVLGCAPGPLDGSFGPSVDTAVRWFQNKYGLAVDGSVGPATWNKMKELIKEIQTALKKVNSGWISIVNGISGPETYNAVCEFQKAKGLTVDGSVGPTTRSILLGNSGGNTVANDDLPLTYGKAGKNVECFQYGLHICGFSPNGFDGSFGPGMQTAVKNFQAAYSLTVDGSVGPATWDKMKYIILPIQQALRTQGWYTMEPDGIANIYTYNAVKGFQSSYSHLTVDGMVGPDTRQLLGLSDSGATNTGTGTISSVLTQGSNGSLVRYLQKLFNTMGYALTVDGSFGPTMHSQVIRFQSEHGLTADGSFGPASWRTLFTYYAIPSSVLGSALYGDRVAKAAEYELSLGFSEDNANDITPYGEWYGMNGQPWCAMFVSWCAHQAGYLESEVPRYAYCPYGKTWYVNNQRYHSRSSGYKPKRGDIVFFWGGLDISHTGVVVSATSSTVTTIEGNASRMVKKCTYDLTNTYIDGYGTFSATPVPPLTDEEINDFAIDAVNDFIKTIGLSFDTPPFLSVEYSMPLGPWTLTFKAEANASLVKEAQDRGYGTLTISNGSIMYEGTSADDNYAHMFTRIAIDGLSSTLDIIYNIGVIVGDGAIYFNYEEVADQVCFGITCERSTLARDNIYVTTSYSLKLSMPHDLYNSACQWALAEMGVSTVDFNFDFVKASGTLILALVVGGIVIAGLTSVGPAVGFGAVLAQYCWAFSPA